MTFGDIAADLVAGMLCGNIAAQLHQPLQGDMVPGVQILHSIGHSGQLRLGIIDQGGQVIDILLGQHAAEHQLQLFPDFTGTGIHDMQKGLILTVDIGHEMLGALGQIQNGPELDDLGARCLNVGYCLLSSRR